MLEWIMDIGMGLGQALSLTVFLAALLGVIVGVIIGVIPGLGPAVAISLAIPLTYSLGPLPAISFMLGIYKGGTYGGSISAILINTPGTPASAASVLDGYPLTQQGKSGKALNVALYASVIGDTVSVLLLCLLSLPLAYVASLFGPPELFSLLIFSLTIIAVLSGKCLLKGIISAAIGLALCMIGSDPILGNTRFSFDMLVLEDGLAVIPMVIGMFAIAEILKQVELKGDQQTEALLPPPRVPADAVFSWAEMKRCLPACLRGSAIGASIGALPGTGSTTAAFLSYGLTERSSKFPEEFGKGSIEGLAAAESGNNAVCGGALIPMLTLGIPGDVITAMLMSALMVHGIFVGPQVFTEQRVFVFGLFGMLLVSIFMLLFVGKAAIWGCRKLATTPSNIVMPIVLILCVFGSYATNYSTSDIWVMLFFGVIGYFMNRMSVPLPPLLIAFVIAPSMEQALRQSLLIAKGDFSIFVTKPISLAFLCLTAFVVYRIYRSTKKTEVECKASWSDD